MKSAPSVNYITIIVTFFIGILLTVMPLPHGMIWFRPQWILAILLFWVITLPMHCGVTLAWCVGVLMDLIMGTVPGQQALIFVLLIYLVLKLHPIIAHSPRWQQTVIVGLLSYFNIFFQGLLLHWMGHSAPILLNSISAITTAIIWPILFIIINHFMPQEWIRG